MAISNHERVGRALENLRTGLQPFVERELKAQHGEAWEEQVREMLSDTRLTGSNGGTLQDVLVVLVIMDRSWSGVFRRTLGKAERSLVNELIAVRNGWAHQQKFSSDDTYRALDSVCRLLTAVSAPEAQEVESARDELLRVRFDEQRRYQKRKSAGTAIESEAASSLTPWREIVSPHADVASGRYQQAEFAADLWQVHLGEGTDEYRDPAEFFRRTYNTESLKRLLVGAVQRMAGDGGDPVVQLQTNFGGGKTHSMLALYHLFSGTSPAELVGVDSILTEAGVSSLPKVNRVVLVGNKISPGNPIKKADGTVVNTLWGELAWQLGNAAGGASEAKKAFERIQADDEKATSPGDAIRELMNEYGPCLILIDEWVAYARQLHDTAELPGGTFETHFTFAQALTESAKLARNCLLVISLPASDTGGSPHAEADDVEVGGVRGRAALDRLRNAVGRVEASWRPASAEEGFEIVRRRLFEPLVDNSQWVARDTVAKAFFDLYRTQHQEFPPECRDADYEQRIKDAYPIHPEIFDRLYGDWSTLVKFQRTRGVLRLMAAVIHSLWEKDDRNPLILPANIAIDDPRVQFELVRYLSDTWPPVIAKDVDGPNSLPLRLDSDLPNLGKYHACRRVARTIYLGSAPTPAAANRGIEDRRVKLGCVMPGESPAVFGDALRRLSGVATYLYQDGPRFWYSTQPTVTKLADDRAEQLKREPDTVIRELEKRVRKDLSQSGDFSRVHPLPQSGQDVPDDMETRLVVLGSDHPFDKGSESAAETEAKDILETRGSGPRLFRNSLVFLAADKQRLQDLDEAIRRFLAWESILADEDTLDLSKHQVKQAATQRDAANGTVDARIPETYQWLLVPLQATPHEPVQWQSIKVSGQGPLAERASKRLRSDELLIGKFSPTRLRMELDRVPLWRQSHVEIRQLVEDFSKYLYLPRLTKPAVLVDAVREGIGLLTWEQDSFAYADSYDEAAERYRGLQFSKQIALHGTDAPGVLVKPEVARAQLHEEQAAAPALNEANSAQAYAETNGAAAPASPPESQTAATPSAPKIRLKRFHGTVRLDAVRVGRDAGNIAEEVIQHLAGLVGADVEVSLEVHARFAEGAPDNVVRTVSENCSVLKFDEYGFEED